MSSIAARRRSGSFSPKTSWRLRVSKVDMLWDTACLLSVPTAARVMRSDSIEAAGTCKGGCLQDDRLASSGNDSYALGCPGRRGDPSNFRNREAPCNERDATG